MKLAKNQKFFSLEFVSLILFAPGFFFFLLILLMMSMEDVANLELGDVSRIHNAADYDSSE